MLKYADLLHTAGLITDAFHADLHAAVKDRSLFLLLALKLLDVIRRVLSNLHSQKVTA
jgi:hypothetical protein